MILILKISRGYGKEAGPERKMDGKDRSGAASPHPCPALHSLERETGCRLVGIMGLGGLRLVLYCLSFGKWAFIVNASESLTKGNQNFSLKPSKAFKRHQLLLCPALFYILHNCHSSLPPPFLPQGLCTWCSLSLDLFFPDEFLLISWVSVYI